MTTCRLLRLSLVSSNAQSLNVLILAIKVTSPTTVSSGRWIVSFNFAGILRC